MTEQDALIARIRAAWCRDTAMNPEAWTPERPETDQCAVTACIVHERLGLPVVRGQAFLPDGRVDSHYWNEGLDLTVWQYPDGTEIRRRAGVQGDEAYAYLMENPDLVARLERLRALIDMDAAVSCSA